MKRIAILVFLVTLLLTANGLAQQLTVTPENPSGVYRLNEPIRWRVAVAGAKADTATEARYEVSKDGAAKPLQAGDIHITSGGATIETSLKEPGAKPAVTSTWSTSPRGSSARPWFRWA